ncbi:LPS export ABC transporter permease LptG [Thiolapillus brandeum]|uniref:Lipopolysaccharide export system permease n=1 Tax=Thiolapillus brandeum TaxID=1076588 RepID=A0A7U6GIS6_9GAMM|nr:LPS export ABC transporter permease LptG [Thiolapillus brandeum]BAO44448.1 lipopolysaccharide export system permease [Thiolapillus brandeum]
MRRIDRYIAVTVIKATLMTLLVLTVLAFVLTLVDEMEDMGKGNYGTLDAMIVAACSVPRFIYQAFPVSALIGALLGIGGMVSAGELVAMRAAGMTSGQIVVAVLKGGMLLMLLVVVIGDGIGPALEQYGHQYRLEKQKKQITFSSRNGFWAKDGDTMINIRRVTPEGRLQDVSIYRFSESGDLSNIIRAVVGEYRDQRWVLGQVRQTRINDDRLVLERRPWLAWNSVVDPAVLSAAFIDPIMLPAWQLWEQIQSLKSRQQNALKYEVTFWSKIAVPLTTLAMLILAMPLVMKVGRDASGGQRVLWGAMLGTLLYLFSRGFAFLVLALDLPAVLVMFFPLVLVLVLALWMRRLAL